MRGDVTLDRLFAPRSIAVAGASNKPGKMGNLFVQRLAAAFAGRLYPINPGEREVAGLETIASIADAPHPIDVLIALVPAERMIELVEACPQGKVGFLLAIPSGFGEVPGEGESREARLLAAARARGIRMVGPNCVGFMNCALGLNASMMPVIPPGGSGLTCITQSGGFGMALSMYALDHNLKVAKFCDLGNMADLQVEEVLDVLARDPQTEMVGLFLEAVRNADAFIDALDRLSQVKPVVLTMIARTEAGRRASRAHLGLASELADLGALFSRRVVQTRTGLELLDAAKALAWQPEAAGPRVGIVTGTGGIGAELADLAVEHGLTVPDFSPSLRRTIGEDLPYYAGFGNPVDLTPIWWEYPQRYPAVLRKIAAGGELDAIIVSITDVAATIPELAHAMASLAGEKLGVPLIVYWGARDRDFEQMRIIESARLPCYRSTRDAVRAAAALARRRAPREAFANAP